MKYLLLPIISLLLTGCYIFPQQTATVDITSVHYLNPDNQGNQKPLLITLYFLNNKNKFLSLPYNKLMNKPNISLSSELLDMQQVEIKPNDHTELELAIPKGAHILGIVASYHQLVNSNWRQILKIPHTRQYIHIQLNADSERIISNINTQVIK